MRHLTINVPTTSISAQMRDVLENYVINFLNLDGAYDPNFYNRVYSQVLIGTLGEVNDAIHEVKSSLSEIYDEDN